MSNNIQVHGQPQITGVNINSPCNTRAKILQELSTNINEKLKDNFKNMVANFFHKDRKVALQMLETNLGSNKLKEMNDVNSVMKNGLPKSTKKLAEKYVENRTKEDFVTNLRTKHDKLQKELKAKLEGFKYTASKIFNPKRNKALDLVDTWLKRGGKLSNEQKTEFDKVKKHLPKSIEELCIAYQNSTLATMNEWQGNTKLF